MPEDTAHSRLRHSLQQRCQHQLGRGLQVGIRGAGIVCAGHLETAGSVPTLRQLARELPDLDLLGRHPDVEVHRRAQTADLVRAESPREVRQRQAAGDSLRLLLLCNMGLQFDRARGHAHSRLRRGLQQRCQHQLSRDLQVRIRGAGIVCPGHLETAGRIPALRQLARELPDLDLLGRHPDVEVRRRAQTADLVRAEPPREIGQRQVARDGLRLLLLGDVRLQLDCAGG